MSAISSTTGGLINFTGLASGVNTNNIIQGLETVNQTQITNLTNQQTALQTEQSSFSTISADLSTLQSSLAQLTSTANGVLGGQTATTSDANILAAAADSTAQAGTYSLTVNNVAQAEQLATAGGVSSETSAIQQGTLQLQVGSGTATTITVNSSNNTLQGLANAINSSGADVQASIVNDGSSTPYRLVLTSTETGAANTIQVTNNLTSGSGASLAFTQTIQPAADAQVTLGSGSGALTFASPSNTISDAITGVTLNVLQPSTTPQTLTIAPDTATASTAIQSFVTAYNAVVDYISQNSNVSSTSGSTTTPAGDLLGNTDAEQLQNSLQNTLSGFVAGINPKANSLGSIGITFNSSGDLEINQTTLNQALSGQLPGVSSSDVQSLFGLAGQSSAPGINFILGTAQTQPSGATPYQVNITQAATQASLTAGTALASTVNIDSTNNNFTINVNGTSSSQINIPTGSYTQSQLATALQTAINSNTQLATNQVSVTLNDSGELQVSSTGYGSLSQITFTGGSALGASGPLGIDSNASASGQDVAGYFVVNGVTESATGYGQILDGNAGNANTNGLQVQVTLNAAQVGSGVQSNLTVTQGLATQLDQFLTSYLAPSTGQMATINNKIQANITTIGTEITTQNTALTAETTSLSNEFAQMEVSISQLQTMGAELNALLNTNSSSSVSYGPKSLGSSSSSSSSSSTTI